MARIINKTIEIEGRRFTIRKYTASDGLKIAKVFIAKVLPVFQDFMPLVGAVTKAGSDSRDALENFSDFLSLDTIAETLDKVSPDDLDYIIRKSLQCAYEILPAGDAQVLNDNGTYGVMDVEYDAVLVLRLVCEAVMWGVGDFFDGDRLISIMSPLSTSLPQAPAM